MGQASDSTAVAERLIRLPDPAATAALAAALARLARPGDVIALRGDLGAGKTFFARAFIAEPDVPSPTFTLVQTYDLSEPGGKQRRIWHFDLYRLQSPEEAVELDIEDAFAEGISLIEWPDRLGPLLPVERLDVELAFGATPDGRIARLSAGGSWAARLAELRP
jgi:tRNA threonylcarbamoyladenosine biosynthesis protein TsaE